MRFVSRDEWGARKPEDRTPIPGPVRGVTLHWEGPHMGYPWPHRRCDNKVRGIQDFHMDGRGWDDIAYSGLVCPHGYVFEGRGPNRRTAANGTDSGNDHWYAICYLAGQGDPFTDDGKQGFKDGVQWLREHGGAGDRVNGHRDHKSTACPGDEIYRWLNNTSWEDDGMPSAKEVAEAVWHHEIPHDSPKNPENPGWHAQNFIRHLETTQDEMVKTLATIAQKVGAPVDINEAELAQKILAGLAEMPDQVAQLVVDSVGPEVARQVVEELGQRINQ